MKKISVIILFLIILQACSSKNKKNISLENISYNGYGKFELGGIYSNEYQNNYFGFSFYLYLSDWIILNKGQFENRSKKNQNTLRLPDSTIEISKSHLNYLIAIEKKQDDTTKRRTQSITLISEEIENYSNLNSFKYLKAMEKYCKENLMATFPKYTSQGITTGLIGNRPFLLLTLKIESALGDTVYQKIYSAQFENRLLNIISNYKSTSDLVENESILKKIKWNF